MEEFEKTTDRSKDKSWWQTLPGILTAIAAILTALTGLFVALNQIGIVGTPKKAISNSPVNQRATQPAEQGGQGPSATSIELKPWSESSAVIYSQDGTKTSVRAETLCYTGSFNHELDLKNGQSIPFEKIKFFEVLKVDDPNAPNSHANITITLLTGDKISGDIGAYYGEDLFGYNDIGRYVITLQKLKRIEFER
jgi:hypothetical protein